MSILFTEPGEDVGHFLFTVAFALGMKEAELARLLGVSRATLSSWKARGAIPPVHQPWFETEFVPAVLNSRTPAPGDDFRHAGLPVVLHLLHLSDGNPFGLSSLDRNELIEVTYRHFGSLVRLGQFVLLRVGRSDNPELLAAKTLEGIIRGAARKVFVGKAVSQ